MVLERGKQSLVIDPGSYTLPLDHLTNVAAIVLTHEHADHWTPEHLRRLRDRNPHARIFGTEATVRAAAAEDIDTIELVRPGDEISVGEFQLRFFGGRHAIIHSSIPQIDNVAVLVNELFYYAGDSFAVPEVDVQVLAAPASGPWMKIAETMDYIMKLAPKRAIAVHELVNSQIGNDLAKARMSWATEQVGGSFSWLSPGESLEL